MAIFSSRRLGSLGVGDARRDPLLPQPKIPEAASDPLVAIASGVRNAWRILDPLLHGLHCL